VKINIKTLFGSLEERGKGRLWGGKYEEKWRNLLKI